MSLKIQAFASRAVQVAALAAAAMATLTVTALAAPQVRPRKTAPDPDKVQEANRREGEALLGLVDAAMAGRSAPSSFPIAWRNDFLKAQPGTLVPFTITIERGQVVAPAGLMYVRAARRGATTSKKAPDGFAFDAIFPVDLTAPPNQPIRITRGFAVPPGPYDVYVAVRERPTDLTNAASKSLRAGVLKQPLSVPDFWNGQFSTSTVMLANRIDTLSAPIDPDNLFERPYVIGQNDVQVAVQPEFRRDRELIVVFLIYNPTVTEDRNFDVQVDYHLFRSAPGVEAEAEQPGADRPRARSGERYVSRTSPQRFNRASVGGRIDPAAGQPLLAGQGILLSSFEEGEYRIGITVTDLLSRTTIARDVTFTVVGS